MDITITGLSDQDVAVIEMAARLRGHTGDWKAMYAQFHKDCYDQVKQTIGGIVADDPVLSGQMLLLLSNKLDEQESTQVTETDNGNV